MNGLPYWLSQPCPPWCGGSHAGDDDRDVRLHYGEEFDVELTLEPRAVVGEDDCAAHVSAGMCQGYRESRPHIRLVASDGEGREEEIFLELAEAGELAGFLAEPPRAWAVLTPTMMDADPVRPAGYGTAPGKPVPEHRHAAAFPFTRPPVIAVRQVLDTVTVFCPVFHRQEQVTRYLLLTPGEAADLAAAVTKLLDGAR